MESWIQRMCRQSCTRQLALCGIFVLVVLLSAYANGRYFSNFIFGPYPATAADLQQIGDPDAAPRYFVHVQGSEAVDTGIQQMKVEQRNGEVASKTVEATYFSLHVGDRWLLVRSNHGQSTIVDGALQIMPPELRGHMFSGENAKLMPRFYSFYLDREDFRTEGYWELGIGLVVLGVVGYFALRAWKRLQDLSAHPVMQRVQRWGDLHSISVDVEQEYTHGVRFKHGAHRITDRYVIARSLLTFDLFRFQDLLWAYKKVTRHSLNFIPTGKTYNALMIFYGGSADVQAKEAQVEQILQYAAAKAPWAVIGFSNDLKKLFEKQTAEFCAAVEARRQKQGASA